MRDILDPVNRWIGIPGTVSNESDKHPVAVTDTLSLLQGSGPVAIDVLANDFDPEGGPLTLLSAYAALGTAVVEANDTVTYTPLPGISGFDTVVYEIADLLDQRRTGQVNITIIAPELSITTSPINIMTLNAANGEVDLTISAPLEFAGSYQFDAGDLVSGPVNLVPPKITGNVATGQVLTVDPGLWIYDTSTTTPTSAWQWQRGGADIPGETGQSYTVQANDGVAGVSVLEIEANSFGQGVATSTVLGGGFSPAEDTQLLGWWDANDAATIFETGGIVSGWADKAGGAPLVQGTTARRPRTGTRVQNGLNVLDFDGSQFLERAQTLPASGDVAFHMVVRVDAVSTAFEALLALDAANNDFQLDAGVNTQFDGRLYATGMAADATSMSGGPYTGWMIVSVILDQSSSGTVEIFVANTNRLSAPYSVSIATDTTLNLMSNRAQNAWIDGAVGELITTGNVANRLQIHSYLSAKWGVA